MEWESDSSCNSHTYPKQEHWSPGRCSGWQLGFRDCGAIPKWGLLLTVDRQIRLRGCEGGDGGGKCLWKKAGQPWKQGYTDVSHIEGGAIIRAFLSPHASISNWTIERLAHQMPDPQTGRLWPARLLCQGGGFSRQEYWGILANTF